MTVVNLLFLLQNGNWRINMKQKGFRYIYIQEPLHFVKNYLQSSLLVISCIRDSRLNFSAAYFFAGIPGRLCGKIIRELMDDY